MATNASNTNNKSIAGTLGRVPKKTYSIIFQLLVVLLAVLLIHSLYVKYQHHKAAGLYKDAVSLTTKGDFKQAAGKLIEAYNTENRDSVKANYAFNIGQDYYNAGDAANGKKWLTTAYDLYTKIGDKTTAASVKRLLDQYAQFYSPTKLQQSQQNAKTRQNVQDSNL